MNDWNEKIEKTMVNLGCKCGAYRIMHDESVDYCSRIDSFMTITSISLSTLTATGLFSLDNNDIVKTVTGITVYFIAFLTSMKEFLNYTKLAEKHKLYSMRFSAIYRDIQRQLCLDKMDRQNGKEYLTFVNNEIDNLLFSNPSIPYRIKKKNLGDYDKNSAHEISLSKDIYDIIIDISPTVPKENENKVVDDIESININAINNEVIEPPSNSHYSRYQVNRFLSNN